MQEDESQSRPINHSLAHQIDGRRAHAVSSPIYLPSSALDELAETSSWLPAFLMKNKKPQPSCTSTDLTYPLLSLSVQTTVAHASIVGAFSPSRSTTPQVNQCGPVHPVQRRPAVR